MECNPFRMPKGPVSPGRKWGGWLRITVADFNAEFRNDDICLEYIREPRWPTAVTDCVEGVKKVESRDAYKLKDRKSTRLNSSHGYISYAVFCLQKKRPISRQCSPSHPR